jgi:heat shock protein HslJ
MIKIQRISIALVVVTLIFSCKTVKNSTTSADNTKNESNKENKSKHVLDGTWEFIAIPGKSYDIKDVFPTELPYMTIDVSAGKAIGFAGCNRFSTKMTAGKDSIHFNAPMMMTKMACPTMSDNTFTGVLENTNRFEVKDGNLILRRDKFTMMTLKRVENKQ